MEVFAGLGELKQRNAFAAIVVHDRKQLLQTDNAPYTTRFDLVTEELYQILGIWGS
jgi:hypothetical protein